MLRQWRSQSHVRWYCRYHLVIVPKYRRKTMFGGVRKIIGGLLKEVCTRYGVEVVEGHVMPDHVHMCIELPPKYSVSEFVGKMKGKTTILLHQRYGRKKNFKGLNFWSRGVLREYDWVKGGTGVGVHSCTGTTGKGGRATRVELSVMLTIGRSPQAPHWGASFKLPAMPVVGEFLLHAARWTNRNRTGTAIPTSKSPSSSSVLRS